MNNRKSILRVLLVFAMVTLLTAAVTFGAAYAFDGNAGECGKGVSWSYADGTLTVSGEGMMSNFRYDTMPWYHLKNEVTTVVIEEGVTHVGELSFYGFDKITEVSLPESTVSIGQYAFYSCRALKSITVPEGVTAIGQYAFRKTALTSAYMSADGWSAGANALSGLDNAEEAAKMLISISEGYCFYLVNWSRTVETEITVIDGGNCGKNVTWTVYSNGLLEILGTGDMKDYGAYTTPWNGYKNRITHIVIGEGVTSVGYCAFYGCTELVSVELPETVTAIDKYAFYDCRMLSAVTVPQAVESIGVYAFRKCYPNGNASFAKTEDWRVDGEKLNGESLQNTANAWRLLSAELYKSSWIGVCGHEYIETVETKPTTFGEGLASYVCSFCGDSYTATIPATKSLKLLAIGNSFSEDAFDHLYIICKNAGIEEIVIGNLYIGGCSLENHYKQMSNEADAYIFYLGDAETEMMVKQNGGAKCNAKVGLQYTDWDYITLQQNSANSGLPATYEYLDDVISYVKQYVNDDAEFLWHMTWAYQADSTSTNFAHYNYDQAAMYNAILDCVQNVVLQNPDIKGVIPSGTAVQNLRTAHLGDTVTDDGRHLSKGIGRYTAGLTYLAAITGYDVTSITAVPSVDNYPNYSASRKENLRMVAEHLDCIKEAVVSAVAQPFAITPSVKFPYVPVTPEIPEAPDAGEGILNTTLSALSNEDREYLTSKGYDPDRYMLLDLTVKANAYYDSSKSNFSGNLFTPSEGGNTYLKFLGTQSFSRNELVNGTLIRVDAGYKYRPEGWISGVKNESSARPAIVYSADAELTVVNDEWWGSWEYRGFNICKGTTSSNQDIAVDEKGNFKIYIPVATKSPLNADDIAYLKSLGLDPNCFMALDYTYTMSAYYNASQKSAISIGTSTLHKEFLATNEKFTRYDIPVGSVIRINTTYRYRAEAWITLDAKVASDDRPARITAATTVVDAAWWADWGYRAFNVQTKNNAVMTEDGADALRIYVPVNGSRYSELEDEDVAYLEAMGLDPDEYMILNFEYFVNAYYNSTQHSELINTDTLSKRYIATEIFTREDLGIGSVIRITKEGYQYRPDAWTELDKKTSGRPGNVTEEAVIVTEEWWGNWNYRAFNISKTVTSSVSEDDVSALKIYVKVK